MAFNITPTPRRYVVPGGITTITRNDSRHPLRLYDGTGPYPTSQEVGAGRGLFLAPLLNLLFSLRIQLWLLPKRECIITSGRLA